MVGSLEVNREKKKSRGTGKLAGGDRRGQKRESRISYRREKRAHQEKSD